jgi:WLM domain
MNFEWWEYIVFLIFIGVLVYAGYAYYEKMGFDLKCVVSDVNGNKYCVRDRKKLDKAADLLAKTTEKCKQLIKHLEEKYEGQDDYRVDRLATMFNPEKIMEILPTSQYTAYSENKGEKLALCLNADKKSDDGNDHLIDDHTLMFVALHELSHIATKSVGHKTEFWENFKFLLEEAKEAGIHEPVDYGKEGSTDYCGMKIHDNPYFDLNK